MLPETGWRGVAGVWVAQLLVMRGGSHGRGGEPVEAVLRYLAEGVADEELGVASGLAGQVEGDHAGDDRASMEFLASAVNHAPASVSGAEADGREQLGGG